MAIADVVCVHPHTFVHAFILEGGKMRPLFAILTILVASYSTVASAVYTRTSSGAVEIDSIYANEWGSPFVTFKSQINAACYGGNGLYLDYFYDGSLGGWQN